MIKTPLLGYLSRSKESFEVLFDEQYKLEDVGEFFREQYEFFRGEIVKSGISRDSLRNIVILEEAGRRVGRISSLSNSNEDDMFRFDSENSNGATERFYHALKIRFGQD